MQRLVVRMVLGALMGALLVMSTIPAATAECHPVEQQVTNPETGEIQTVYVQECTDDGGDGTNTPGQGGTQTCPRAPGGSCLGPGGSYWFNSQNCYGAPWPEAPPEHPAWNGHESSQGSLWSCKAPLAAVAACGASIDGCAWFVPGNAAPIVDPTVLAREALGRMPLATAEVHLAPTPPNKTYVGLDTWLWVPEGQWNELTQTVSVGGTSVTVTAKPVRSEWDMSTGQINCYSPGREWVRGLGDEAQTNCSYAWQKVSSFEPDGTFKVSAAIVYEVSWNCSGLCLTNSGTLPDTAGPAGSSAIRVGERQTVVIEGTGN